MSDITAYEAERNARVAANKKRMMELNLPELMLDFQTAMRAKQPVKRLKTQRVKDMSLHPKPILEKRRSGRLQSQPAPNYNEAALDKADAVGGHRQDVSGACELYTEEHIKQLGSYEQEWTLFVDGYDSNGERIYDRLNGLTCHQCRQKTIGLRTKCSCCESLKGVFCGDCLFMRYGENVLEANKKPDWSCPSCRGICNCSICRLRKGLAPTGSLYRQSIARGYKSVAHMIILQNQAPAETLPTLPAVKDCAEKPEAVKDMAMHVEGAAKPDKPNRTRQQKISNILPQRRQLRSSCKLVVGKGKQEVAILPRGLRQRA